jgi:hypothetical protein
MRRLFLALSLGCLLCAGRLPAANITWVSFHATDAPSSAAAGAGYTEAPDIGYTDLLTANGHNVTRFLTHEPLTADELNTLNASDLVIIGRSVNSGHYEPSLDWNTKVTAPVMIMGGYVLRSNRLNLTDGTTIPDTSGPTRLHVMDPSHPIFEGVALDAGNVMVDTFNNVVAGQRGTSINTNNIVGGTLLATISADGSAAANGPVIAEWAAGAAVNNGEVLAGPRLVFLSGSREADGITSETAGIYDLSPVGAQMFLNAVNYTAIPEPSTAILAVVGLGFCLALWRRK